MNDKTEFSKCFVPVPNFPPQNKQTLDFLFNTNQNWGLYSLNASNIMNDANSNCNLKPFDPEGNHCDQSNLEVIMKKFKADDLQERRTIERYNQNECVSESSVRTRSRKGKKYQVFTDEEKVNILDYLKKNGMKKTIETFSTEKHRLTQRKLRCWAESQVKVKEHKGRKIENPAFDQAFLAWCLAFKEESGRAPNKIEAKIKALRMSEAENFKASKGWLRRFTARHKFTFSAFKDLKKPPEKSYASELSVSTAEASLNLPGDTPQLGDEFFNFDESCSDLEKDAFHSPIIESLCVDTFDYGLTKNDFDIYFFLKSDARNSENEMVQDCCTDETS